MWVEARLRQGVQPDGGGNLFLHVRIDLGMNGAARLL
jgi:hypothetical protein